MFIANVGGKLGCGPLVDVAFTCPELFQLLNPHHTVTIVCLSSSNLNQTHTYVYKPYTNNAQIA